MGEVTCDALLRTGPCQLGHGHRGRHATVVFWCDGHGKHLRGSPVAVARNPYDGVVEAQFCWLCVHVAAKEPRAFI